MKACKIDIKQTWVDFKHGIYREAVYDQMNAMFLEEGKTLDIATFKENTYYPVKVYEPGYLETKTYLVRTDEQDIFRDLMTIQQNTLNEAVEKAVQKKWEIRHYQIESEERKLIKSLPWYKRLFNNF